MSNSYSKWLRYLMLGLCLFGSFMIASAEMGVAAGQTDYLSHVIIKQVIILCIGGIAYIFASRFKWYDLFNIKINNRKFNYFSFLAIIMAGLLILPRLFGQINGAYAWIIIGNYTIQPSEFAKVFLIIYGAKMLGVDHNNKKKNMDAMYQYMGVAIIYVVIIALIEKDLGSAIVMAGIVFGICLLVCYKGMAKFHNILIIVLLFLVFAVVVFMSPLTYDFLLEHSGDYRIGRFLAAANPFADQYSSGYHVIMSLVTFATGGLFGLGYGKSIHKYMNFPNPSNDFILPVIVEETGIVGFCLILFLYGGIMFLLMKYSLKTNSMRCKIVYLGTFMYFALHFIFNVGGVSGFIPLTGVPLLLLSSGGSSTMAAMAALGICQYHKINEDK